MRGVRWGRCGHQVSAPMFGEIARGLIKPALNLLLRMRSDHEIGCLESMWSPYRSPSGYYLDKLSVILKLPGLKFLPSNQNWVYNKKLQSLCLGLNSRSLKADEFLHRDSFWTDICECEQALKYQDSDISLTYEISTSGGPLQTKMFVASDWIQARVIFSKNITLDEQTVDTKYNTL